MVHMLAYYPFTLYSTRCVAATVLLWAVIYRGMERVGGTVGCRFAAQTSHTATHTEERTPSLMTNSAPSRPVSSIS
jgi:hypothetical protein